MEFSEYVVDSRDLGPSDQDIADELNPLRGVIINGKRIPIGKGRWNPRDDHRGGTLQLSVYEHGQEFLNGQLNSIEIFLMDPLRNGHMAKAKLIVDSLAPDFVGDYKKGTQCEMVDMRSFRCEVSQSDIKRAVLAPERTWPAEDYSVKVTTEETEGRNRYWLYFLFKKDVPEESIAGIMTVDLFDNTNFDRDIKQFFFKPATTTAELIKATAFNGSVLEVEFSKDVGSIESVLVDGVARSFDLKFVDNAIDPLLPPNVVVHFTDPLPDGIHDVELKGLTRVRNRLVRTEVVKLNGLDNRVQSILQSSITQEPDLKRTTDLRFEVTRPFSGAVSAFVRRSWLDDGVTAEFRDFTLTAEGRTPRGTYAIRLHKNTAAELSVNAFQQHIILQLPNQPSMTPVPIGWPTREPMLRVREPGRPSEFRVSTFADVDLDSLELEIVDRDQVITISRSWISSYENGPNDFGLSVALPDVRLKPGLHTLRVKAARTVNFGISLSKPYELYMTIN
jgi:hypothetical protein